MSLLSEREGQPSLGAGRGGRRMRCVVVKSVRERSVRDDAGDDDILCTRLIYYKSEIVQQ